jgi:hypothetical protein
MDGTRLAGFGVSTGHMGPNWNVVAAGDFHGNDGQDLLWLSATGDVATWSMHGSTLTGYTALGHMGVEWHVAGSGDFNRGRHRRHRMGGHQQSRTDLDNERCPYRASS